jgi:hypothetical protein
MDYSVINNKNLNLVNEFRHLIDINEDLAIQYIDNILGVFLSKEPDNTGVNMLMYAIIFKKEKLVNRMIEKNVVDLNHTTTNFGDNALMVSLKKKSYKIALKILDTGITNLAHINNEGEVALDFIKFEGDINKDPDKNEKLELMLKLLYFYIETDNTNSKLHETIDYICKQPGLIKKLKEKLTKKKSINIDINKFMDNVNLDDPKSMCSQPVNANSGVLVKGVEVVSTPIENQQESKSKTKKKELTAKNIKAKPLAIGIPETDDYIDEEHDDETVYLMPRRSFSGGKRKTKRNKKIE